MWLNIIKIAFRNMLKQKTYSSINILGLGLSIGAVILILLYVSFEFSYDNFHKDADSIYRISVKTFSENKLSYDSPVFTPPIGSEMKDKFAMVENYTRHSTNRSMYLYVEQKPVNIDDILYADSTFLNFFTFEIIAGSPGKALAHPYSIVLSEETAVKIFGSADILGRTITDAAGKEYEVTGIVKSAPSNSSIKFNALISFATLYTDPANSMGWNGGNQYITYVRLAQNTAPEDLQAQIPKFMWENINKDIAAYSAKYEPYLQPLNSIHFIDAGGYTGIYIFAGVGILILLIASINFINLTTAQYSKRSKEIGVRKVLGADKKGLVAQFLTETIFITMIALAVGLVFAEILSPLYRTLMQTDFPGLDLLNPLQLAGLIVLLIIIGFIAGSYPAFYLSSFDPAGALRKDTGKRIGNFSLQNLLIVFQFGISVSLIIITIVVSSQMKFVNHKELGYNKENIVLIPLSGDDAQVRTDYIKQKFLNVPGVLSASASSQVPSNGFTSNGYVPEGYSASVMINVLDVDEDFFKTYNIKLIDGRKFTKEYSGDKESYIVNEALAKSFGWKEPVGKQVNRNGVHEIIGMVNNFNYASLHEQIEPLIITNHPYADRFNVLSLKVKTSDYNALFTALEKEWKEAVPSLPFEYSFLDEKLERVYNSENNFMQLFSYLSILAIVIAAMGLFSLSSLAAEQKTKEIGIRKVLGAGVSDIVLLMVKKYLYLVLIANLIAVPFAYHYSQQWLAGYAFRIDLTYMPFLTAFIVAMMIVIAAVGYRAIRAASSNMIQALKYE